jgi:hypothetical protein
MPFYTWTRKNVPYQIRQVIRRPGRAANFSHVMQESEYAAGDHNGEHIPSFFSGAGAFRVPGIGNHWYYVPNMGLMDLSRMSQVKGYEQMLAPWIQIPITLATNRNLYTGAQVAPDKHGRVPINPLLGRILSDIPFVSNVADIGMTQRLDAHGNYVHSTGSDPYALYMLESLGIPLTRVWVGRNPIDESHRPGGWLQTLSSQAGFPLSYADQAEQQQILQIQQAQEEALYLENLRAQGFWPEPKKQKRSAAQRAIDAAYAAGYGRP